jgi:hypothetical protein
MLNVVMLSVVMLSVFVLSVFVLSVFVLSVVAPFLRLGKVMILPLSGAHRGASLVQAYLLVSNIGLAREKVGKLKHSSLFCIDVSNKRKSFLTLKIVVSSLLFLVSFFS